METKPLQVKGRVVREHIDVGSKSERDAVMLETAEGSKLVLRNRNGPAFGDLSLESLVGASIVADGVQIGQTLIMKEWHREDER